MWTETAGAIGVGYEGANIDDFVDGLKRWGVGTVVDVRLNPLSRKRGFSKNQMREALANADIEYIHQPALGNPKENREGYSERDSELGRDARARFVQRLSGDDAQEALKLVAELAFHSHVAIMCFEAHESLCHRREVLRDLDNRLTASMVN